MKAFNFTLKDELGNERTVEEFKGKKVILYFYPKDNTPGCTQQACNYRDNMKEITDLGAVVIGISKDSSKTHKNFIEKQNLNFILLSDPEGIACEGYGVWKLKKLYGREYMGIERTTFLIDEEGTIVERYEKVSPKTDTQILIERISKSS